jgi:hypothetical protein
MQIVQEFSIKEGVVGTKTGLKLSDSGNRGLYCARIWGKVPSGFSLVLGGDQRTGHQMILAE